MSMKTLLAGAFALAVTFSVTAAPQAWLNGGIDSTFPNSTSMSGGSWGTPSVAWDATAQAVVLPSIGSTATFTATDAKDMSTNKIVVTTCMRLTAYDLSDLPAPTEGVKVGLAAVETETATKYYYLAKGADSTNVWVASEITAADDAFVNVEITLEDNFATYKVGDTTIAAKVEIATGANATVSEVMYKGMGAVKSLAATTELLENGTAAHPFLIDSAARLQQKLITDFASLDAAHQNFVLTDDIDMTGIVWDGPGESRTNECAFVGVFDGNGYTISNLTLAKKEYNGFIGCACGAAQIKNLTIQVAGFGGDVIGGGTAYGGAGAVGFSMGTDVLVERVTVKGQTAESVLAGTHNIGGIGCRLEGVITLRNCTNELDLSTTYSKIAGMCPIASSRDAAGLITFDGCVNKGAVSATGNGGADGCSGILGYIQNDKHLVIRNCENYGEISAENVTARKASIFSCPAGQVIDEISGNRANTNVVALANSTIDGLNFATVDADGIATMVSNSAAVAGTSNLKVMAAGAPVVLATVGDTITLDETLAKATVTTTAANAKVVEDPASTYTVAAKTSVTAAITLTGATATVSVENGAMVYEGTTVTVSNEAAAEGYKPTVTVTINGVERKSYTVLDTDTELTIAVVAEEKDAVTVVASFDPAVVEYTAGMTFPLPTVTVDSTPTDNFTTNWSPVAITEPTAGETNEYEVTVNVAATDTKKAGSTTAIYKVWKKAGGSWNPSADPSVPATDVPGLPNEIKGCSLAQISVWATGAGKVGGVDVAPADVKVEAFLLNCENTEAAITTAKANFKFTADDLATILASGPSALLTLNEMVVNGTVTVKAYSDVGCTTESATGNFFKATLTPTPAPVK